MFFRVLAPGFLGFAQVLALKARHKVAWGNAPGVARLWRFNLGFVMRNVS
jgi:hypothetical protein